MQLIDLNMQLIIFKVCSDKVMIKKVRIDKIIVKKN
jgi:hypothetical protein